MNADGLACLTQPLCASAAHKQGWAAVDELGDLSMDDTGWQDVALQEDGAVSSEEDGLVQAAAQAAEPQGGQLEDLHGHGLSLKLVDPSVAKERSEWSKSRLLKPLHGILNRVRLPARIPSEVCFQQWPPSELLVLDASPDFVPRSAVEDAEPSGKASSEGDETVDPVAEQVFVEKGAPENINQRRPCHVQRNNHSPVLRN